MYSQCVLTIASRVDVMNRLGRAMADPTRSRILLTLLDGPGYPAAPTAYLISPMSLGAMTGIAIDGDVFEAHFNLGNIFHDLARYREAQTCYREALRLNPQYADAHFYLAVTLEKGGQSHDARAHWRAYQQLAPQGEWVDLAREFSD